MGGSFSWIALINGSISALSPIAT